ncbi:MAG: class I SAM-dependent methyltransferase, partial [Saprospiraceae bacterium]|nr:class I SAM-dependent methyltransferase [Saprospiraceae bacterium]
ILFEFIQEILDDERVYYSFEEIEAYRAILKKNHTIIQVNDLGAGSNVLGNKTERKISDIASSSLITPSWGQFLFRLMQHYAPKKVLELGTSLGISGAYISTALPHLSSKLYTVEGCENIANIAKSTFDHFDLKNVKQYVGDFSSYLSKFKNEHVKFDIIFIDGNHTKDATLQYFEDCQHLVHSNSIIIFDDIHWKSEMNEAWHQICDSPNVKLSIDLFKYGIIFFGSEIKEKQHFTLIKSKFKWWKMGFFR